MFGVVECCVLRSRNGLCAPLGKLAHEGLTYGYGCQIAFFVERETNEDFQH